MTNKHYFEALDNTSRDILRLQDVNNSSLPFGGMTIIIGGDSTSATYNK